MTFCVGDRVQKVEGYKFPGIVIAKVRTTKRYVRYVVECTAPDCAGMLQIFTANQLFLTLPFSSQSPEVQDTSPASDE